MFSNPIKLESGITLASIEEIKHHDADDVITVAHVLDVHELEGSVANKVKLNNIYHRNHKLIFTLLLSVSLHGLVYYFIDLGIRIPNFKEDVTELIIVQAKLYKPPQSALNEHVGDTEPIELEPVAPSELRENTVTEEHNVEIDTTESTKLPQEMTGGEALAIEETVNKPNTSVLELPQAVPTEETVGLPKSLFDSPVSRHISELNEREQNGMVDQAAKDYQYHRIHSEIKAIPRKTLTVTEQQQKAIKLEFDCKTATSKALGDVLRYVSGFMWSTKLGQGAVRCYKQNGEINSFIKKRVQKK